MARLDSSSMGRMENGLTERAHMSVRDEREGATAGMHKPEEKAPFSKCAKASRADWAERWRRRPGGSWPAW
jgi:hypothetical protein